MKPAASPLFAAMGPMLILLLGPTISLQAELRAAGGFTVVDDASTACRFTRLQQDPREIAPSSEILSCKIVVRSDAYCGQDEVYGASKMVRSRLKSQDICLAYEDQMI
jgi:hypothetical protein